MILFFGYTMLGGTHCADSTPTDITNISEIRVKNVIVDGIFLTKETDNKEGQLIPPISEWNYSTVLNAPLEGNLLGGNVNFTADQVLCMRLKRAEIDSYKWLTLFEIPINSNDDLAFTRTDITGRGCQEFKYALVPVWNDNIEGNYNVNTIVSDFDGLWIMDSEISVNALIDLEMNTTRNMTTSVVKTLGSKYPYVNQYGLSNYTSGSFTATFIHLNTDFCELDIDDGVKYREMVEDFLTNGSTKIVKHFDGRIWLAAITDTIPKNESRHYELPQQTVNFVEVGRFDSSDDLYRANLIDVNIEGGMAKDGILSYSG